MNRLRRELHRSQGGKCFWCGLKMVLTNDARHGGVHPWAVTREHLFPRETPERGQLWAIVGAHTFCNYLRARVEWDDFFAYVQGPAIHAMVTAHPGGGRRLFRRLLREALDELTVSTQV